MTRVTVIIKAWLILPCAAIPENLMRKVIQAFTYTNPDFVAAQKAKRRTFSIPPKICTAKFYAARQAWVFPRGGATKLREVIEQFENFEVVWDDRRTVTEPIDFELPKFEPRAYQIEAVKQLIKRQQGILIGGTGSGKTLTSISAAVATQQRTMVIVWNRDLISYWREEILKSGYLKEEDIGLIWGKERKHGKITIAMQQTLLGKDVKEFAHLYGCVIIDEADRQPARSFVTVMSQFSAKYRWGLTADETRKDGKEFVAYDVLGPVLHRFEQATVTAPPFITFVPTTFKYKDYNPKKYFEFLEALLADEERNNLIARHLYHELKAGHRILLFCDREEYVTMWYEYVQHTLGFESGTLMGGLKNARVCGRTTKEVIDGVNAGKIQFVAGTSYCDKALNMPILDTGFFICPAAADLRRMNQQVGRIVREYPGKEYARIFYFVDEKMSRIKSRVKFIKAKWPKWKYWGEE